MSDAYATDYFGWTQAQADALRRRSANELDWDNLREEVESLGKQERNELRSHLKLLLLHLLKWTYQPARRSRSWSLTIREQRSEIARLLKENPSLAPQAGDVLAEVYESARLAALRETRLAEAALPATPPFDLDAAMTLPVAWTPQPRTRTRKTEG